VKAGPDPKNITQCRFCDADIVFLKTLGGKQMPVNVVPTLKGYRGPNAGEVIYVVNEHQSHIRTCDDPE
jgi:hypothetical protein